MNITRTIPRIAFCYRRFLCGQVLFRIVACAVLSVLFSSPRPAVAANTTVHMITNLGPIDIQLYDDQAPKTVVNFLRYAGRGDYHNSIIHRSIPGFAVQGGGYSYLLPITGSPFTLYAEVPSDPPVQNEFSHSNTLRTIAMAKLPGNPDSATNQWFINLADNGGPPNDLDSQNGGYTVFGNVIDTLLDPGMSVVNAIAAVPTYPPRATCILPPDPSPTCASITLQISLPQSTTVQFLDFPLINYSYDPTAPPAPLANNLVYVTSIPNVTATKTTTTGTTSAYAADLVVTFTSGGIIPASTSESWLQTFIPPPGKTVQFNDEVSRFTMTWPAGTSPTRVVTLYHGAATSVNGYYAYGPTASDPSPHWYDFSYDGTTGAEFVGNQILLHFVDGQRGDDDLAPDGSITHTGAPVLVTDIASVPTTSAGCSIAAAPSQMRGNGDWIVVAMFLAFVAVIRKRTRRIGRVGIAHRK
ncbi:MAG: peptidylprolyl isomerase [Sulfuricaulis sp.]